MAGVASYAQAAQRNAHNMEAMSATRAQLEQLEGGIRAFTERLVLRPIFPENLLTPDGERLLDEYVRVLATGILERELVPYDSFKSALTLKNQETILTPLLGKHKYLALAVISPDVGMIGAVGLQIFCHLTGPATLHASYYAVLPAYRGCGVGRLMMRSAADWAVDYIAHAWPQALTGSHILQFIETNDIAKMTLRERLDDEAIAMHPLVRDQIWETLGFREIGNIRYHQRAEPPLPFALKVQSIEVVHRHGQIQAGRFRPLAAIEAAVVLRHVIAFDNLLLNFDEAVAAVTNSRALPDLRTDGLLEIRDAGAILPTVNLKDAQAHRRSWIDLDHRIRNNVGLHGPLLDKSMAELSKWSESRTDA